MIFRHSSPSSTKKTSPSLSNPSPARTSTPSLEIRAAHAGDVSLIHALVRALAEYERAPDSARLTEATLLRDGFGAEPAYRCLVAEMDGVGCGFALFFPIYSTWDGRSLYLEDLFVQPEHRGRGIGKALLMRVAGIAAEQGCARLDWSVLRWNEPAIGFYESLGAVRLGEWDRMRLAGAALQASAHMAAEPRLEEPIHREAAARSPIEVTP